MDSHVIGNLIEHGAVVNEFHIRRPDGVPLPDWLPGAHIALRFSSAQGRLFENGYALIGTAGPADTCRIAVQRSALARRARRPADNRGHAAAT